MLKTDYKSVHFWFILGSDALLISLSLFLAFFIRFEFSVPPQYNRLFCDALFYFIGIKLFFFLVFSAYRGMWRYTSLRDLSKVVLASLVSSLVLFGIIMVFPIFKGFPRSVLLLDYIFTTGFLGIFRISIRIYYSRWELFRLGKSKGDESGDIKRIALIGAGDAGEKILREIQDSKYMKGKVFGFFDDNPHKMGGLIHGIAVLGKVQELPTYREKFDEILICIPTASGKQMRRIVDICKSTGKKFKTLPGIYELIDGSVSVNKIREVSLLDLLGRKEVKLDHAAISDLLKGKRIMVTGAGGSIGSELVRQCITFQPSELMLLDASEQNLFQINLEAKRSENGLKIHYCLADIRKKNALERIFFHFKPEIVLHAAAYKHVPIQEDHPWEAVFTNILGTANLIECSQKAKVQKFVLVSTDKAVRPANIMGMTKRIAEILIQETNHSADTEFLAVRFGNVIGSSGSVIPIFQEQIRRGEPLTVTHKKMRRYFMSIPEASQLILQAATLGKGGEIFILNMGEQVYIDKIARELIKLSGLEPDMDIPIIYTGIRPGEKLDEELISDGEDVHKTENDKILVLNNPNHHHLDLAAMLDSLYQVANSYDYDLIRKNLLEIIQQYN